jgi:hypothetical protein
MRGASAAARLRWQAVGAMRGARGARLAVARAVGAMRGARLMVARAARGWLWRARRHSRKPH